MDRRTLCLSVILSVRAWLSEEMANLRGGKSRFRSLSARKSDASPGIQTLLQSMTPNTSSNFSRVYYAWRDKQTDGQTDSHICKRKVKMSGISF